MSELAGSPTSRLTAMVVSLGLLLGSASCASEQNPAPVGGKYVPTQTATTEDNKHPIEPCFDKPLANIPGQTDLDGPHYDQPLVVNAPESLVEGEPKGLSADLIGGVIESIVVVESEMGTGTGFITKNSRGEDVVVTAAHVIAPGMVEDLTVIDDRRQKSKVTAACYVYENRTGLLTPKLHDRQNPEHDIAVLKLSQPLGQHTLNLSLEQPKRGEWVFFNNYQKDAQPPNIVSYSGIVVSSPPVSNYEVVTGIHGFPDEARADHNKHSYRVQRGASGGPVLDQAGNVVGTVESSDSDNFDEGPIDMKVPYDITFNGATYGPSTGFEPKVANVSPSFYIQQAIESPKLG